MHIHEDNQETTFYEQIQNNKEIDLRDERGKRHDLSYILLGLTLGLLRKRDGNLSSIHRSMENKNDELCAFMGIEVRQVVSRSHLPVVLQKVNLPVFEKSLFDNYGVELSDQEKAWFSGDGKDLRGSIERGNTRGEAVVQLVNHDDGGVLGQDFYSGDKESEKPCLQNLIHRTGASSQKLTMDALHLCPAMTGPIEEAGGTFIIGLKENQKALLGDMEKDASFLPPLNKATTIDKGHGRLEQRTYYHYDVSWEYFDDRWSGSNFQSLFKVERNITELSTGKKHEKTAFYISNAAPGKSDDFFAAIRNHWSVEVCNHIRDVTFSEDHLKTKIKPVSKVMAGLRTLAIKLLDFIRPQNRVAQLELFQDKFDILLQWLRNVKFL